MVHRPYTQNHHFLCDSCSGSLQKYTAIDGFQNYADAQSLCMNRFGTGLASIHSDDDMNEAVSACSGVTLIDGCWIGMDSNGMQDNIWTDGTVYHYGEQIGVYPWNPQVSSLSMTDCVVMDPDADYLWTEKECQRHLARVLCNAPSELCISSQWLVTGISTATAIWTTRYIMTMLEIEKLPLISY